MIEDAYNPVLGIWNLIFSFVLIIIVIAISHKVRLEIEKEILIAVSRAVVQLMAVVIVIAAIFETGSLALVFAALFGMLLFAAKNSADRADKIKDPMHITLPAIGAGAGSIILILIIMGVIPLKPEYLIPIGSMAIGGTMIVCSLVLNRYTAELSSHKAQIEAALCLGAENGEALMPHVRQSVRASLIPTIDRLKTLGIVILPGAMAGLIIGGVNPIWAAEYQLVIMFMIFSSETLASVIAVKLLEKRFDVNKI
ncbi:iron export ABC transporter permease subunit FetB [Methanoplanus sp. FWC-SCC4]|uniref:Iron export ABC transporter permease subunit FetB n=1 Tax=Methanochimaera problematica TaxID=2609417 RepID=A0AA97I588_9EURY|nr:iron export ABC transporter permease subunit FetB [Methanoplanus sp. FWC-SCC4]WOF17204.1 iron export ABC transporter permease subunit FetB [Methanoplanus sp. FWC-SCC4]